MLRRIYYIIGITSILFVIFSNIQNSYSSILDQFRNNTYKNLSNINNTNTFGNSTTLSQSLSNNNIAAPNSLMNSPFG